MASPPIGPAEKATASSTPMHPIWRPGASAPRLRSYSCARSGARCRTTTWGTWTPNLSATSPARPLRRLGSVVRCRSRSDGALEAAGVHSLGVADPLTNVAVHLRVGERICLRRIAAGGGEDQPQYVA